MITRSLEELKEVHGDYVTEDIDKIIYSLRKDLNGNYEHFIEYHKKAVESDDQKEVDECYHVMDNILWDLENSINEVREMIVIEKASKK